MEHPHFVGFEHEFHAIPANFLVQKVENFQKIKDGSMTLFLFVAVRRSSPEFVGVRRNLTFSTKITEIQALTMFFKFFMVIALISQKITEIQGLTMSFKFFMMIALISHTITEIQGLTMFFNFFMMIALISHKITEIQGLTLVFKCFMVIAIFFKKTR